MVTSPRACRVPPGLTALGKQVAYKANVPKVSIQRNDVSVTGAGVNTPTPFGFGGWVAMTKGAGGMDVMMRPRAHARPVNPIMSALRDNGIEVMALHNHFLWDEPGMFRLHLPAHGKAAELAREAKPCLDPIDVPRAAHLRRTWSVRPAAGVPPAFARLLLPECYARSEHAP